MDPESLHNGRKARKNTPLSRKTWVIDQGSKNRDLYIRNIVKISLFKALTFLKQ